MEYIDQCDKCKNFDLLSSNKKDFIKMHCRKNVFQDQDILFSDYKEFSTK